MIWHKNNSRLSPAWHRKIAAWSDVPWDLTDKLWWIQPQQFAIAASSSSFPSLPEAAACTGGDAEPDKYPHNLAVPNYHWNRSLSQQLQQSGLELQEATCHSTYSLWRVRRGDLTSKFWQFVVGQFNRLGCLQLKQQHTFINDCSLQIMLTCHRVNAGSWRTDDCV